MKESCGNCELRNSCFMQYETEYDICEYYEPKCAKEIRKPKSDEEKK